MRIQNPIACSMLFTLMSVFACTPESQVPTTDNDAMAQSSQEHNTESMYQIDLWPTREPSPPLSADIETQVADLIAVMTVEEKVGQIIQPELKYVTPEDVRKYHLGSILNGGGTTPHNNKRASLDDWVSMAEAFYEASMDDSDGYQAIPLIWGSDAVHGHNNLYGATIFPHNIGLGAANDPELMTRIGVATAREMAASGLDWTFGPTVAVVRDDRWGRTYESYSEDPEIVSKFAAKLVYGIQGDVKTKGADRAGKIVATAKHYLGDGGTTNGIDRGDTKISESELRSIHAAGYISALDSNVLTTMASFNSWNGERMHGHSYLLTDILKNRMNFNGFVVGDWNGHQHVAGCTTEHCPEAINAGLDMFMVPEDWEPLWHNTLKDVKEGRISMQRLDDAVTRILRVKMVAGLFNAGPVRERAYVGAAEHVGSAEHRAIAREAVRKSLVLLKNDDQVLPLKPSSKVLVTGDGAHNIGKQSGGWTLTWQGTGNNNEDFPGASSVLDGIKEAVSASGGTVDFYADNELHDADLVGEQKPDVAIVVFGEDPYAEWHGDVVNIEYQYGTKTDLALLKMLQEANIPVVSIFLSGRPLWVNKELNASDAFVAAWLPGSEGAGIADVIFTNADGEVAYDFTGRLSFSWPKFDYQANLNKGDDSYEPLFAYGYGLSYADQVSLGSELPEDETIPEGGQLEDQWVFVSRVNAPWNLYLQDENADMITVDGNRESSGEDDNLFILSVDKVSQEDARRVRWQGLRPATLSFQSKFVQNLSKYQGTNAALVFDIELRSSLPRSMMIKVKCGESCYGSLPLSNFVDAKIQNAWQTASVPLDCLGEQGLDLSMVNTIFALHSAEAAELSLANIKLKPNSASSNCGAKQQ